MKAIWRSVKQATGYVQGKKKRVTAKYLKLLLLITSNTNCGIKSKILCKMASNREKGATQGVCCMNSY